MSDIIGNAQIILAANTARFDQGMARAKDSARETFADMKDQAVSAGKGIAVGLAVATVALGEMIKSQVEYASEMESFAKTAGVSVQKMQEMSAAAKILGMDTDDLNDVYDDLNQKIGEFTSKGEGELKDLFEQLPKAVNLTAESFRKLSGPEAMQKYYDALEKSNLTEREKVYWMEQFASESSKLIPLLRNHGELQREVNQAMEQSGAIMNDKTLKASRELKAATSLLDMSYQGVKNQLTQGLMPVLSDLAGSMVKDAKLKDTAKTAGDNLAVGFKVLMQTGRGVVGIFEIMGKALGGFAAAVAQLGSVMDGVDFSSPFAFFQIGKNMLGVPEKIVSVLKDTWADIKASATATSTSIEGLAKLGTGESSGLVKKLAEANSFKAEAVKGKAIVKNDDDDDDDDEKGGKTKKIKVIAMPVNARVLENARRYNFAELEKANDLPAGFLSAIHMQESHGNPNAVGPMTKYGTAKGGFQMIDPTAAKYGLHGRDVFDLAKEAPAAAKMLKELLMQFGSVEKAAAAYNTGPSNVENKDWNLIMSDRWARNKKTGKGQTKEYVHNVMGYMAFLNGKQEGGGYNIAQVLSKEQQSQKDLERQRLEFDANKQTQIDEKWKAKWLEVKNNPQATQEDIAKAKEFYQNQAKAEWQAYQQSIKEQVQNSASFAQSESQKIIDEAKKKTDVANANPDLNRPENAKAKAQILANIEEEKQARLGMLDLAHTKEEYNNNKEHYTTLERIKIESGFKQAEIEASNKYDQKTKERMLEQLQENTETLIQNANQSFKDELQQLTGEGTSELQKIIDKYNAIRLKNDKREDIDPDQKSALRNASAIAQNREISTLKKQTAEPFNALEAETNGTKGYLDLTLQYQSKLEVIKKFEQEHTNEVKRAESLRLQVQRDYATSTLRLTMTTAQGILDSTTGSFKTMFGEQSRAYRTMFAMNQSFAMAEAGVHMYEAWGKATAENVDPVARMTAISTIVTEFGKIINGVSSIKMQGFASGGYTGDIPENAVAGLVHGGEYVFDAEATKAIGKNKLEKIRRGDLDPSTNTTTNNAVSVNVAVNADGSSSVESSHEMGKNLGNVIQAAIQKELVKQTRQGGLLSTRGR